MRTWTNSLPAALVVACCSAAATTTNPATISVGGAVLRPMALAPADLPPDLAAAVTTVHYESLGRQHAARAVPLLAVLRAAGIDVGLKMGPRADPRTKNRALRLAVVVAGRDGYAATFALAELLPEIGDRPTYLALDADGHPLSDRAAPAELIAPDDAKPGRWVRGVASVTVIDPAAK